jgi:hypothetical protein
MTKECLVILTTSSGQGIAEIHVNSLQQLEAQMPVSVVSYDIQYEGSSLRSAVIDDELHDLLLGVIFDIEAQHPGTG